MKYECAKKRSRYKHKTSEVRKCKLYFDKRRIYYGLDGTNYN